MPSANFDSEKSKPKEHPDRKLSSDMPSESIFESKSDFEIWEEFKKHNESAFIFIYSKYFKKLYQFASQFTKDSGLIKDAIQDLFIDIRRARANLSATNSIKRYLFKSIRRKVLYYKSKRKVVSLPDQDGYHFSFVFSHEYQLIQRQLTEEMVKRLNGALSQLTSRQKEAVYHFYYEGMSYSDIAEVMDLRNVKSARNLIYKALGELKEGLGNASK